MNRAMGSNPMLRIIQKAEGLVARGIFTFIEKILTTRAGTMMEILIPYLGRVPWRDEDCLEAEHWEEPLLGPRFPP